MTKTTIGLLLAALLVLGGCDDSEEATPSPETTADNPPVAEETPAEETPEPAADEPCPTETSLTLGAIDRSEHLAGMDANFAPTSAFADVTLNRSASIVFTSYEFEADPQFGMSAPVGDPGAPEGGLIFQIRVDAPETLANGEYDSEGEGAGRVSFTSMYRGSDRILPMADHTVRITEVADDHICGEIVPAEGANYPTISGRFKIDKV